MYFVEAEREADWLVGVEHQVDWLVEAEHEADWLAGVEHQADWLVETEHETDWLARNMFLSCSISPTCSYDSNVHVLI